MMPFSVGDDVLCNFQGLPYEARILSQSAENSEEMLHRVHYQGWNRRFDEWVFERRLLRKTDQNLLKAVQMRDDAIRNGSIKSPIYEVLMDNRTTPRKKNESRQHIASSSQCPSELLGAPESPCLHSSARETAKSGSLKRKSSRLNSSELSESMVPASNDESLVESPMKYSKLDPPESASGALSDASPSGDEDCQDSAPEPDSRHESGGYAEDWKLAEQDQTSTVTMEIGDIDQLISGSGQERCDFWTQTMRDHASGSEKKRKKKHKKDKKKRSRDHRHRKHQPCQSDDQGHDGLGVADGTPEGTVGTQSFFIEDQLVQVGREMKPSPSFSAESAIFAESSRGNVMEDSSSTVSAQLQDSPNSPRSKVLFERQAEMKEMAASPGLVDAKTFELKSENQLHSTVTSSDCGVAIKTEIVCVKEESPSDMQPFPAINSWQDQNLESDNFKTGELVPWNGPQCDQEIIQDSSDLTSDTGSIVDVTQNTSLRVSPRRKNSRLVAQSNFESESTTLSPGTSINTSSGLDPLGKGEIKSPKCDTSAKNPPSEELEYPHRAPNVDPVEDVIVKKSPCFDRSDDFVVKDGLAFDDAATHSKLSGDDSLTVPVATGSFVIVHTTDEKDLVYDNDEDGVIEEEDEEIDVGMDRSDLENDLDETTISAQTNLTETNPTPDVLEKKVLRGKPPTSDKINIEAYARGLASKRLPPGSRISGYTRAKNLETVSPTAELDTSSSRTRLSISPTIPFSLPPYSGSKKPPSHLMATKLFWGRSNRVLKESSPVRELQPAHRVNYEHVIGTFRILALTFKELGEICNRRAETNFHVEALGTDLLMDSFMCCLSGLLPLSQAIHSLKQLGPPTDDLKLLQEDCTYFMPY